MEVFLLTIAFCGGRSVAWRSASSGSCMFGMYIHSACCQYLLRIPLVAFIDFALLRFVILARRSHLCDSCVATLKKASSSPLGILVLSHQLCLMHYTVMWVFANNCSCPTKTGSMTSCVRARLMPISHKPTAIANVKSHLNNALCESVA